MRPLIRHILFIVGLVATAMGFIGVFLPMWPTTPFLLVAVFCFMRSSERMHRWVLEHRLLGPYVRDFVSGKGMPRHAKVAMLALMWITSAISSGLVMRAKGVETSTIGYAAGLAAMAAVVTWYVGYRIPTRRDEA